MKATKTITFLLIVLIAIPGTLNSRAEQGLVLTVGPGGTHSTIQAAVNAALGSLNSSPIEIRVATGTYTENIRISDGMNHGSVTLTGGWSGGFTSRDLNPALTTIDGSTKDRVFSIYLAGGELTIDGFTITEGSNATVGGTYLGRGGGLLIHMTGDAKITVINNRIWNNTAGGANWMGPALDRLGGGGIYADVRDTAWLLINNNIISGNRCDGGSSAFVSGAGLWLDVVENALFTIRKNQIENNTATTTLTNGIGAGIFISAWVAGSGEFSDNLIRNNSASGPEITGVAGALWISGIGRINARRNAWVDNLINLPTAFTEDVSLNSNGSGTLLITDSIVAGAKSIGVSVIARESSAIYLTNLTIADNQNRGVFSWPGADSTGIKTLYNSILYNNGIATDLNGVGASNNLIGVDPKFVNSAGRDYHLLSTSPAINAGINNPPGALGPMDLDQHDRITGDTVDIGAYEMGEPDFALGFDQAMVSGTRGTKVKISINITRISGFAGAVTVSPPDRSAEGIITKFPEPITTAGQSVSFKFKIKAWASPGPYQLTFTGRDDSGRQRNGTLTLLIQ